MGDDEEHEVTGSISITLPAVVARMELGQLGAASAELVRTKKHEVEEALNFLDQFADHILNFLRRPDTDLTEWRYDGDLSHGEIATLIDSVLQDRQRNREQAFEERMQAQQQAHERELRDRDAEHEKEMEHLRGEQQAVIENMRGRHGWRVARWSGLTGLLAALLTAAALWKTSG